MDRCMYDVDGIRKRFPPLTREKPFIYLDSAATGLKPHNVIRAVRRYLCEGGLSVHRSLCAAAINTTTAFEDVRRKMSVFIGAPSPENIIFTPNATFAISLVARNLSRLAGKTQRRILVPLSEHHSNMLPWMALQNEGFRLEMIPLGKDGTVDFKRFLSMLKNDVALVAAATVTNVTGAVNPIYDMCCEAKNAGALFLADNAQGFPRSETSVKRADLDFMAFSGHKAFAPPGAGVLYGKSCHLEKMEPLCPGGGVVNLVEHNRYTLLSPPWSLEGGTPDTAAVIGLGAALDFILETGIENIRQHEDRLTARCMENLKYIDGISLYGPEDPEKRRGIVSFSLKGWDAAEVCRVLDKNFRICVRGGLLCAMPQVELLNPAGVVRASFGPYSNEQEIDILTEALKEMQAF